MIQCGGERSLPDNVRHVRTPQNFQHLFGFRWSCAGLFLQATGVGVLRSIPVGAIENSIYISLGLIFLADMHTVSRKQEGLNASRPPAGMAGALLLGGLLTAFQLLPSYEMLKYSVRAEVKPIGNLRAWDSNQQDIPNHA